MALRSDVLRITRALNWVGALALALGIVIVVWALWWTSGVDDFRTAVIVAALGFGLPSIVALTLAWMLDPLAQTERIPRRRDGATPVEPSARSTRAAPAAWMTFLRYVAAVGAVVLAVLLRKWLDPIFGDSVPFITFYIAVVTAAWVGGFGPAALATVLCMLVAWRWILDGASDVPRNQLGNVVAMGVFAATALAVGGITSAMRATSAGARRFAEETALRTAEFKSVEEELRRERDRIRVILDSIGDAVITTDVEGRITFMNPAAQTLTGWLPRDALGRALDAVVALRDASTREPLDLIAKRGASNPGTDKSRTAILVDRLRNEIPVSDRVAPIVDAKGASLGHVIVFRFDRDGRPVSPIAIEDASS